MTSYFYELEMKGPTWNHHGPAMGELTDVFVVDLILLLLGEYTLILSGRRESGFLGISWQVLLTVFIISSHVKEQAHPTH